MTLNSWIEIVSAIAVLYVSYRILGLKEWFRTEMTKVVTENCAGKVAFDAHCTADELFQKNLMESIVEKREQYTRQHADHYKHEANAGIHQESMSADLLKEKFENVKEQVAGVKAQVIAIGKLLERSRGAARRGES